MERKRERRGRGRRGIPEVLVMIEIAVSSSPLKPISQHSGVKGRNLVNN